jgi:hypothetical protein
MWTVLTLFLREMNKADFASDYSHDLNLPIHTVLVVVPFPYQGNIILGS